MAEVMAVWAVEVWVAVANGDRDARWVHNIATSWGLNGPGCPAAAAQAARAACSVDIVCVVAAGGW